MRVPPARNYPSPLVMLPAVWQRMPVEGAKIVPLDILWGAMGGAGNSIAVNLANNSPANFTQICAFTVDNTGCGADVAIVLQDTNQTITVPAYTSGTYPAYTGQVAFFVVSPLAIPTDETLITVHNYMPPVIDVPKSEFQSVAVASQVAMNVNVVVPLIAAGVNGTISGLNLNYFLSTTAACGGTVSIRDGNANVLFVGGYGTGGAANIYALLCDLSQLEARFQNGLNLVVAVAIAPTGSQLYANVYYRTP